MIGNHVSYAPKIQDIFDVKHVEKFTGEIVYFKLTISYQIFCSKY